MRYASFFSGIEAASVAWHSLGWEPVFFSEIEPFPNKVLAHHYPTVPNLGDITKIKNPLQHGAVELMVGGSPCQSFSVAGLRKGLADPRGNLALEYLRMADTIQPRWIVWENVPGVLSSNGGRDFGAFLGALAELGYGFAYRVLDAQFFGVPQRRRRVFVVAHSGGNWLRAAAVLFESESVRRDFTPGGKARKEVAPTLSARTKGGGGLGTDFELDGGLIQEYTLLGGIDNENNGHEASEPTGPLLKGSASGGGRPLPAVVMMATGQGNAEITSGLRPTLSCNHEAPIIAFDTTQITSPTNGSNPQPGDACHPLCAKAHVPAIAFTTVSDCLTAAYGTKWNGNASAENGSLFALDAQIIRRITPMEAERLQGFPDNYTNIQNAKDTPRYRALGNSMAVPVMRWIGERIQKVDSL